MNNFGYGIKFAELYQRDGLVRIDNAFVEQLKVADVELFNRLMAGRADASLTTNNQQPATKELSQLLLDLAPHLEDFIGELFAIKKEILELAEAHHALAPLYKCKRLFVQRRAAKALSVEEAQRVSGDSLLGMLPIPHSDHEFFEIAFAKTVMGWLEKEEENKSLIELAARYAAWALYSEEGKKRHKSGVLFKQPLKLDYNNLVAVETQLRDGVQILRFTKSHLRARDGFALTDDGGTRIQAMDSANYCIFCHNQGKDSCSKGLKEKSGEVKVNPLDIVQAGCPLEEKISEMNMLKSEGVPVGALAMITVDNPMCAGTGHRICNDCMKSCIYQKQEPVNIPHVETFTLKDVLGLPYGFEIYSLLTRWNPLNLTRPVPKPDSGYKVLVAGLGPSGYTLAHHLMNDGHIVVGIDGLKIEPVSAEISGVKADGSRCDFIPIKDVQTIYERLDERTLAGFGGVAEYGITVRWDKNYLKILRLLLERRTQFAMFGGVRFGSSLTYDTAFDLGFDHIALCMGAGKPTVLDIPNALARGVRTASDFLMALQLTGAGKKDSIANLQIRLPIVVIGGGLTAIDTATESLAYYPVQVEKFLARYEILVAKNGAEQVRKNWSAEEIIIAEEFIAHAKAIRTERKKELSGIRPDVWGLLDSWGGVKLVYRKRLIDAPSYRLNHEEVEKAFEEGIFIAENYEPTNIDVDEFGAAKSISLNPVAHAQHVSAGSVKYDKDPAQSLCASQDLVIPARTILVAAGTSPNTVLQREDPIHFQLDGKYFRAVDENGNQVKPERISKPKDVRVLLSVDEQGRAVSFFGDLHPSFAGNVVKAMGSAKQGYSVITSSLQKLSVVGRQSSGSEFIEKINAELRATIHAVNRLTPNIIEVVVHAPLAARQFQPGQFYRLQNYEANALKVDGGRWTVNGEERKATVTNHNLPSTIHHPLSTILAMEGLALTGAWVDKEKGLLATIVLEMGGSSDLCQYLKVGEPVILMGPTGTPTEIPHNENVMLVGGGLGNAVLFSIGKAMRDNGCKVLYFAGYKKAVDRYKVAEIEAAADIVIWCCDEQSDFAPNRPQDRAFKGNIVDAIRAYGENTISLTTDHRPLTTISHIIAIGSDRMMAAVAAARHGVLHPHLNPKHIAIGSINSPMQCMMKEICAQCLQKHIDPVTGKETYVYSCFNQDQNMDTISWQHLNDRLKQNSLQEKLTAGWIKHCLSQIN
ncbi:MAG: pyridine nucleotide-disulfide oxidoreductase [Pseudomonadota bacterium]